MEKGNSLLHGKICIFIDQVRRILLYNLETKKFLHKIVTQTPRKILRSS